MYFELIQLVSFCIAMVLMVILLFLMLKPDNHNHKQWLLFRKIRVYEARGCMAHIVHNEKIGRIIWTYLKDISNSSGKVKMAIVKFESGEKMHIIAEDHYIFNEGKNLVYSY